MVFLAKVEIRTRLMQRHLESPLIYIGEALAGMGELPRVRVASVEEGAVGEIVKGAVPHLGGHAAEADGPCQASGHAQGDGVPEDILARHQEWEEQEGVDMGAGEIEDVEKTAEWIATKVRYWDNLKKLLILFGAQ